MLTMRRTLIAIQIQDDIEHLFNDLTIVRDECLLAQVSGRVEDLQILSRRDSQLCTELTHLAYHLGRSTPNA